MQQNNQLNDSTVKTTSKFLWLGLQASVPFLAFLIILMDNFLKMDPIMPELKNILIGICIITIPLALLLKRRFRQSEQDISENTHAGIENSPEVLQKYIQWLIIGMSLTELPAMFGLVLYFITGEINFSLFFMLVSFIFGFLYKPSL